jgi:hypothetical protein
MAKDHDHLSVPGVGTTTPQPNFTLLSFFKKAKSSVYYCCGMKLLV